MSGKVFVSGISGFIAANCVDILVRQKYSVVGSVRSLSKAKYFKDKYPDADIQFVEVPDLSASGAFDEAIKAHSDIKYVLHLASPFRFNVTDPDKELITPAINGTLSLLEAVHKYGPNVKKVVITSSFAAMIDMPENHYYDTSYVYNEKSWNPITREQGGLNAVNGYFSSKKLAEKAAWDFIEAKKPSFKITTIQFPVVIGPPVNDIGLKHLNESSTYMYRYLDYGKETIAKLSLPFYVDVRDAALAHVKAIQTDKSDNKRWFIIAGSFTSQRVVDTARALFPEERHRLPVGEPGSGEELEKHLCVMDNSVTTKESGIQYLPFEKTIKDTYTWFLQREKIEKSKST